MQFVGRRASTKPVPSTMGSSSTNSTGNASGAVDRADHHQSEDSHDSVPKEYVEWVCERIRHGESIAMPDFSRTFGYSVAGDAHAAFANVLSVTVIPRKTRRRLKEKYEVWRRNHGDAFWASRSAMSQIEVSTKRAVEEIVQGSDHIRKRMIRQHVRESIAPSRSTGQAPQVDALSTNSVSDGSTTITVTEAKLGSDSAQGDSDYVPSGPSSARSSLNSIDFKFINRLVGPGSTSSRLRTPDRLKFGQTDISQLLMDARRVVVKRQSEINNISDLLTLNFIFDMEFMRMHLLPDIVDALPRVRVPPPVSDEVQVLSDCSIYAASHTFMETKRYIRRDVQQGTMIGEVLRAYTTRPSLWQAASTDAAALDSLPKNEDTYIENIVKNIILGVFGDYDVVDHWTRDPLPTAEGFEEKYIPDFYAEKAGLPFLVVEVKKPEADSAACDGLDGDRRKLPCMMKLMLDRMLDAGVQNPTVIGLLVNGCHCDILFMTLEYEALYICEIVGSFELPRNNLQLGLLLPALGPLLVAQKYATKTLSAIDSRTKAGNTNNKKWLRPSYYIKGIRIPGRLPPPADL